jgi:hypothetical protein
MGIHINGTKYTGWCRNCANIAQRYSIDDCHISAIKNKGKWFSTEYINGVVPMKLKCFYGHEWMAVYLNIVRGNWCFKYMIIKKKLGIELCHKWAEQKGGKCLSTEYNNKDDNNLLWECKNGHQWKACFGSLRSMKSWCPYCLNKTEIVLYEYLKTIYTITRQFKIDWCKNPKTNRHLPFDFVIEEFKLIIELDGVQHFTQVSNWKSPQTIRTNDIYKMKCAIKNGYSVIRLLQEDVFYDRIDWKNILQCLATIRLIG